MGQGTAPGSRKRLGIFTDEERYPVFRDMLRAHGIEPKGDDGELLHPDGFPASPDWRATLAAWDRAGVDVAIVDDAAFADKEAMVAGLGYFLSSPRPRSGHLRPVFVADTKRGDIRETLVKLASSGVYDLVLAAKGDVLAERLADAVRHPAKRSDVAPLIKASPVYRAAEAPDPVDRPLTRAEQVAFAARGKSVIAVAGIMPRSGATNCSIVLARHLAMLGQTPALVVDKRTGSGFTKGYRYAMASDGKSFRVNGVDIFPADGTAVVPRRYSHVVLDAGYLPWGQKAAGFPEDERQAHMAEEFSRADLQVVYLPCCSPADFEYLNRFFESQSAADLERYAIGVWGATDELFAMLEDKFLSKAPQAFLWNVAVYRWPLSLGEMTPDIVEVLRPVLPRGVADRALRGLGARGGRGSGGSGDTGGEA